MDEKDRKLLQKNLPTFVQNLRVEDIKDHLYAEDILTAEDMEVLGNPTITKQEAVRKLIISILPKRGSKAFCVLMHTLRDTGYEFVAEIVENTEVSVDRTDNQAAPSNPMYDAPDKIDELQKQLWLQTELLIQYKKDMDELRNKIEISEKERNESNDKFVQLQADMERSGLTEERVASYLQNYLKSSNKPRKSKKRNDQSYQRWLSNRSSAHSLLSADGDGSYMYGSGYDEGDAAEGPGDQVQVEGGWPITTSRETEHMITEEAEYGSDAKGDAAELGKLLALKGDGIPNEATEIRGAGPPPPPPVPRLPIHGDLLPPPPPPPLPSVSSESTAMIVGRDIVHYMIHGDEAGPVGEPMVTMRAVVKQMTQSKLFEKSINVLEMDEITGYDTLFRVADDLLSDGIHWGRIVALYAFSGWVGQHFAAARVSTGNLDVEAAKDGEDFIADFLGFYMAEKVNPWIEKNGGWESFTERFGAANTDDPQSLSSWKQLVAVVGLGALVSLVAISKT